MKTVMQNHILHMKKLQAVVELLNVDKDLTEAIFESIEGCIINAESSLWAEKDQIMEAFVAGDERGSKGIPFNAEQYYIQTFKSDE